MHEGWDERFSFGLNDVGGTVDVSSWSTDENHQGKPTNIKPRVPPLLNWKRHSLLPSARDKIRCDETSTYHIRPIISMVTMKEKVQKVRSWFSKSRKEPGETSAQTLTCQFYECERKFDSWDSMTTHLQDDHKLRGVQPVREGSRAMYSDNPSLKYSDSPSLDDFFATASSRSPISGQAGPRRSRISEASESSWRRPNHHVDLTERPPDDDDPYLTDEEISIDHTEIEDPELPDITLADTDPAPVSTYHAIPALVITKADGVPPKESMPSAVSVVQVESAEASPRATAVPDYITDDEVNETATEVPRATAAPGSMNNDYLI
jgi:hypothetical protein